MLASDEYAAIKADYDRISRAHFSRSYYYLEGMSFARSDALFPSAELSAAISAEYEGQCRLLCYGAYPSWPPSSRGILSPSSLLALLYDFAQLRNRPYLNQSPVSAFGKS